MEPTAKIQQGNDFLLKLRPRMIDGTLVSPTLITDLVVNVGGTVLEHNIDGEFVTVQVPAGQPLGKYDVTITGKIGDRKIRDCRKELFERVPDGEGIPYAEYVTDFYIIGSTDEELERMKHETEQAKRDYLQAKAAADAARAEYIRKAELLDDIVTNTKLDENTAAIMRAVEEGGIKPEQFEQIAKADELAKVQQALNIADPAELTPMTDEEILKAYDGYDVAGEHTMGIADQTYGHLVPAEVTIDSVPFTMYQERTYAAYGYTTLYDAQGQQININKHPEEGEHLFTVQPEPEPDPVNVTIDGVAAEVDSTKTYAENGYSAIYKNNDAADATADYPQEGDVLVTDPNVVDLGLSVLWCRTNLGAETQTSVGPYYPWGKKNGYTPNAQGVFEQAYFTSDAYATLPNATNNDAIYEQSDGAYRMPTKEEFNELKANTHMTALASSYAFVATDGRGSVVLPRNNSAETDRIVEHQSSDQPMIWTSSSESFGAKAAIGRSSAGSSLTIGRASAFCGLQLRGVKPIQNNN